MDLYKHNNLNIYGSDMNIPCTELRYVNFSLVFKHFNLISVLRCASVYRLTIFKLQLKLNLLLELGQQLIDYGFIRTVEHIL